MDIKNLIPYALSGLTANIPISINVDNDGLTTVIYTQDADTLAAKLSFNDLSAIRFEIEKSRIFSLNPTKNSVYAEQIALLKKAINAQLLKAN